MMPDNVQLLRHLVLIPAAAIVLMASSATAAGSFAGQRVYVANYACTGHAYKPRTITLACGDGNL